MLASWNYERGKCDAKSQGDVKVEVEEGGNMHSATKLRAFPLKFTRCFLHLKFFTFAN